MRLAQNALKIGRRGLDHPVRHVLHHRLQRGDGGAQLVAHVRHHIAPHLIGVLQFLGHFVERAGQLADLIVAVGRHVDTDAVIALRHRLGRVTQLPQRRDQTP